MAKLEMNKENLERMAFLEGEIRKAIVPYRDNTEAAIAVFALVRVAKALLGLYPPATRGAIVDVAQLYLMDDEPNAAGLVDVSGFQIKN